MLIQATQAKNANPITSDASQPQPTVRCRARTPAMVAAETASSVGLDITRPFDTEPRSEVMAGGNTGNAQLLYPSLGRGGRLCPLRAVICRRQNRRSLWVL